jgi:hypothetical protein
LKATDGKYNASTLISINLIDVNDQPPVFDQSTYETNLLEEEKNMPKTVLQIRAIDPDKVSDEPVIYSLEGQGVDEFFSIDQSSGKIRVLKSLDRDPPTGIPRWEFVVRAIDENGNGLSSYANVKINLKGMLKYKLP